MYQRRMITLIIGMMAILMITIPQAFGGMKGPKAKEMAPVTVKLDDLSNILHSKEVILVDMVFVLSNPNPYLVKVTQLEWTVTLEKIRLGTLSVPEAFYIPPQGEVQVRKTYFLNAKSGPVNLLLGGAVINLEEGGKVFEGISKAIGEERAVWNLEGAAYVESKKEKKSFPFSIEFTQIPPGK